MNIKNADLVTTNSMAMFKISVPFLLITSIIPSSGADLPTKAEQVNLLKNVDEVFVQLKSLVTDETAATDQAIQDDVDSMANMAQYAIGLLEELTLSKLSSSSNRVCSTDPHTEIINVGNTANTHLAECRQIALGKTILSSHAVSNATQAALARGQLLLDSLSDCSKKHGFGIISCYRKIITTDVVPVKTVLLEAIEAHRVGKKEVIDVRRNANRCVETAVAAHGAGLQKAFEIAKECTK